MQPSLYKENLKEVNETRKNKRMLQIENRIILGKEDLFALK